MYMNRRFPWFTIRSRNRYQSFTFRISRSWLLITMISNLSSMRSSNSRLYSFLPLVVVPLLDSTYLSTRAQPWFLMQASLSWTWFFSASIWLSSSVLHRQYTTARNGSNDHSPLSSRDRKRICSSGLISFSSASRLAICPSILFSHCSFSICNSSLSVQASDI